MPLVSHIGRGQGQAGRLMRAVLGAVIVLIVGTHLDRGTW